MGENRSGLPGETGQNWSKQGQNQVKLGEMSLGTPKFQRLRSLEIAVIFFDKKKRLHGGTPNQACLSVGALL